MKAREQKTTGKVSSPARRKRFLVERLEERIAPKRGGKKTFTANCATESTGGGSGY